MEKDSLELTFSILNALGSIATFFAFLFLFRRDKDKQKQIDKLTHIAETLKSLKEIESKKLRISVRPDLCHNGAGVNGHEGELKIDLNNKGATAYFFSVILKNGDIELHNNKTPFEIEKDGRRYIFGRTNGLKNINNCDYEIELKYRDKADNEYFTIITGQGIEVKRLKTVEL